MSCLYWYQSNISFIRKTNACDLFSFVTGIRYRLQEPANRLAQFSLDVGLLISFVLLLPASMLGPEFLIDSLLTLPTLFVIYLVQEFNFIIKLNQVYFTVYAGFGIVLNGITKLQLRRSRIGNKGSILPQTC